MGTAFAATVLVTVQPEERTMELVLANFLLVAGMFVASGAAEPVQPKIPLPPVPVPKDVDPQMPYFRFAAKAADDCARACDTCAAHCAKLLAEGKKEHLDMLRMCLDCADICSTAGRVIAKDGPLSSVIAASCAEACKRCADYCEKYSADPIVKLCVAECRKCEEACRKIAKDTPPSPKPDDK